jgi:iduronate 2-sulfatase
MGVAAGLALAGAAAAAERLNVLFIASDDMRPQLGCYGDALAKSPNLDRLAARGRLFERAYCQQALCSPSRISLLSGRRISTTKINQIGPPLRSTMPDIVTLPQMFKNAGWHVRSLGKIYHVGIDDPASWSEPPWHSKAPRYGPGGTALVKARAAEMKAKGIAIEEKGPNRPSFGGPAFEGPDVGDEDLLDGDTAREALDALRAMAKTPERPFFLAVGFSNPHVPWVAPKRYWDLYRPQDIPIPTNNFVPRGAPAFAAKTGQDFMWYGNIPKDRVITPEFGRQCLHGYLAAISYVDAQVGRLLDELDRLGLREKTIVVFWGDHGYYMGEHGWWGSKHNNYEGATRAPLIFAAPGMKAAGKPTKGVVEFIDIFPTLADLAGLPAPAGIEGRSLRPLLDAPAASWKAGAISQYMMGGNFGTAIRTDRYRYVEWVDKKGAIAGRELYDHQADPDENVNVLGQAPEAMLHELAAALRAVVKP